MYTELYRLRARLKEQGKRLQGRAPIVCSDDALYEMTALCPKKLSDFEGVAGIGRTFIENYGEQFLALILKYDETPTEKAVEISPVAVQTLKELEKKLVNINRRNRLLYLSKTVNKYAVDLYHEAGTVNLMDILFWGKSIAVSDISSLVLDESTEEQLRQHRRYVQLLREINKDLRDKGQNDLYIGYPFVKGRLPGENFDVRAPLALFPVVADVTPVSIKLQIDGSRDILYNNTLILAYYKFNNISTPLPNDVIEDISPQGFLDALISFYQECGVCIQVEDTDLCKLAEYRAGQFPKYRPGELYLEPCMVLGKFPIRSSSIQKDFDDILAKNEINVLLNDLLLEVNDIDYYSDAYAGETEVKINDRPLEVSEHKLTYINDLNSSQENVLSAIDVLDELVIQGPPGTGKSQTITSLIAEFVSQGKTVLMVSEKKTALDVVCSRLGPLSNYALLIDDVGNKDMFYQQLSRMVNMERESAAGSAEYGGLSDVIDSLVQRLEFIAETLYAPDDFGVEPYKLYLECKRMVTAQRETAMTIVQQMDPALMELPYNSLQRIHHLFADEATATKIAQFISMEAAYPWLSEVRGDMTDFDAFNYEAALGHLKVTIDIWRDKNFLVKLFTKGPVVKEIRAVLDTYYHNSTRDMQNTLLDHIDDVVEGAKHYISYQELRPLYERLSDEELLYFRSVLTIKPLCGDNILAANDALLNQILYSHIMRFEAQNRILFQDIDHFDAIIRSLSEAIAKKKKLTRQKLKSILAGGIDNLTMSKRHGEILRALDSKRKWSVNKFVRKFDFELFKSVKIWLLTPEVVSEIIPLEKGIFDLVVFDEASQMYVEKGIPSILRAKKVVVAGDHKQLRPSSLGTGRMELDENDLPEDAEISAALEEESLLDLARFKYQAVMLNFHYRSKYEELIAFSNYAFYQGKLHVSPNMEISQKPPIEVHKLEDAVWADRSNHVEAKYIVELLKTFFKERRANETIGIITFNVNQRDLIDDLIDGECAKDAEFGVQIRTELARRQDGEDIGLFVKSIESVQGDERDVIIFSIGYAKNENGRLIRNFGWLNQRGGENRLNVAISRARKKVHIVTSIIPSELQVEDAKNDGPRILKKYLEYAFAVSAGDKESAKQILHSFADDARPGEVVSFDSIFEEQVYDELTRLGYQVDTQVGIGGYSIDLAIKKGGSYVLGIECDGRLYHSSKSARERDYHRQKYLESRGWRIHRIWSTNWWKHPEREITKICNIVGEPS